MDAHCERFEDIIITKKAGQLTVYVLENLCLTDLSNKQSSGYFGYIAD